MTGSRRPRRAFTIVELLVVIGIIAVLAGMLLPAISSATRRAKKVEETNRIRQVGIAWNLYANGNDDAALPGYLEDGGGAGDENVQEAWNVHYKLPDKEPVPDEDAAPWPWRLMPYLDYDHEVMLGYLELEETSELIMADYTRLDPDGMHRPTKIARHPAFGYNAYYTGGWWEMMSIDGRMVSRPRFNNAHNVADDGTPTDILAAVVAFSPSSIRNTTDYVIFCSSTDAGSGNYRRFPDFQLGSHYVVPPFLAQEEQWNWGRRQASNPDSGRTEFAIEAMTETAIPIGRYTGQAAVLHADLHTAPQAPGALKDQRFWISTASGKDYVHSEN